MRKFMLLTLSIAGLASPFAHGQEPAKVIAPLIDDDTVLVIHVDLGGNFDLSALLDHGQMLGLFDDREFKKLDQIGMQVRQEFTRAGGREFFLLAGLGHLPYLGQDIPTMAVPLEGGADAEKLTELLKKLSPTAEVAKVGRFLVATEKSELERLRKIQPKARPELAQAFAAAGVGSIRLAFLPPPELRRAIDESLPLLPKELGGVSSKTLTHDLRWLAAGLDIRNDGEFRLILQAADAAAAQSVRQMAGAAIDVGLRGFARRLTQQYADKPIDEAKLDKALALLKVSVQATQVTVAMQQNQQALDNLESALGQALRNRLARAQGLTKLKHIGLAFHSFNDQHGRFPGNIVDKNGKALLSWRVAILPYIEQQALFDQFHLDEPWDSEHNKKLLAIVPSVYHRLTSRAEAGKTTILMPIGKNTLLCPDEQGIIFKKNKKNGLVPLASRDEKNPGIRFQDISDGTSNTILAVDAADELAVPWTKPDDWHPDAADPRKGVVGSVPGGFQTVFADGSGRFLGADVGIAKLRAYLTRNGGEVIGN